jgi:hypothetical protein
VNSQKRERVYSRRGATVLDGQFRLLVELTPRQRRRFLKKARSAPAAREARWAAALAEGSNG